MEMPDDFPTEIKLLYVTPEWGETEIVFLFEGQEYTQTEINAEIMVNPRAARAMAKRVQWFMDNEPEPSTLLVNVSDSVTVSDSVSVSKPRQKPGLKGISRSKMIEMCEKYEDMNAKYGIYQKDFARSYTDYSLAQFKRILREYRMLKASGAI